MAYECKQINSALNDRNYSVCERILEEGFDPNQLGPDGVSPMHLAAGLGIEAVCLLLQHGGNPNIRSSDGTTPVHVASMWGEPDCLQILLANGGDPYLEDQDGLNALELARKYRHPEITAVLEQYMALLNVPTEETITPKYTYTRRSTGSSVRSESPELSDMTLDTSAYDTQKLHEYLREFTKRRRSSMYLRSVQNEVDKHFGDGQRTHIVDVTSPDHPYIEPRFISDKQLYHSGSPCLENDQYRLEENTMKHTLSPGDESLHLHLSVSDNELSTSCDSFVTCDGESLEQLNKSFNEGSDEDTNLLNTVVKNSKFLCDTTVESDVENNTNQSHKNNTGRQTGRSRGDKYCKRVPLFLPPETQDLLSVQCDLCGRNVEEDLVVKISNETICKNCEKLSQELDDLLIDRSNEVKTARTVPKSSDKQDDYHGWERKYTSSTSEDKSKKVGKAKPSSSRHKDKQLPEDRNNSHQNIDELLYKLRQSSLHSNPKINVHNIPYRAKHGDWKNDSLISADESFIEQDGMIKSEFHPSDISTITVDDSELDTVKNEAFVGFCDEIGSSTTQLKDDADYKKTNLHQKVRHMSTITEVTELDDTQRKKNNAFLGDNENKIGVPSRKLIKSNIENGSHRQTIGANSKEAKNVKVKNTSPDYKDLWDEVRANAMRRKNLLDMGFIGRDSLTSYGSDATVEYVYTDPENGIKLIERHIPSVCGSVGNRRSIDSQYSLSSKTSSGRNSDASQDTCCSVDSENTEIYDWREQAMCEGFGIKNEADVKKTPTKKQDFKKLDNKRLRAKLCNYGDDPGPVTDSTRQTYLTRLSQLENDPEARIITKKSPEYPSELCCALKGNLDLTKMAGEEEKMFAAFQNPKRDHRWREGTLKSSFNYILLDPRITKNLPNRACNMNDLDVFQCFISAIFYVGKGKRARPYCHLYEAIKQMQKPTDKISSKVAKILDIWSAGLGVVSLHCFQSVIPVEAYTREACMVDALGLHKLTNMKRGDYYGIAVTYSMKKRREMGVYLLTKASKIFLAEGERQISPLDIKADCGCG